MSSGSNAAEKDLSAKGGHDMFAYLAPEDIDPRFGGGNADRRGVEATFNVAVVGVGVMGQGHITYQTKAGRAKVRGLYDTRERSVQTALTLCLDPDRVTVYDSPAAACSDPDIDAVIIATPNCTHREMFDLAITNGKHVLLEKPMATTVADAWAMVRAVEGYDRVVMVGLEYRLKPVYLQAAHEVFARKTLGDVKMIQIMEHRPPFLNKAGQWNKFSKYSGGTLVEKCCHYLDQFNVFAAARPTRVFASGSMAVAYNGFEYKGEQSDIIDNAFVIVEYGENTRASLDLCMFAKKGREEITIVGDRGRLHGVDGPAAQIELQTDCRVPDLEQTAHWNHGGGHSGSSPAQAYLFADAVQGRTTDYPTVLDGFWSVVVGLAAERSVATRQPVEIQTLLDECGCDL